MAYKYNKAIRTSISRNTSYEGERIEKKIERITNNNEPIDDTSPLIYTERKDGVLPAYDIRTDRFETAIEAMDKVNKMHKAQRMQNLKDRETKTESQDTKVIDKVTTNETGGQSTQDGNK